ncbi:MAG TPA: ribosome-inactivating family protein [Alloacidobacterium sp.]|nr:ribosome-inactivating family protein [Alloacidobacterium sp.]
MPDTPKVAQAVIDLRPASFQSSLNGFRLLLETTPDSVPFLWIAVRTPADELVDLQIRSRNIYVVGFKGGDGWYCFDGEHDALGKPCGTKSNYNNLGKVGTISYDDLKRLGELGRFRKGKTPLDKRLCAILIAITSEATRFATVATYFTGLTNSVGTAHSPYLQRGVDFEYLRSTYFTQWEKPPDPKMEPGKAYHFVKGEILRPHK